MPESTVRALTSQEIHRIAQGAFRAGADAATRRSEWDRLNERIRMHMIIDRLRVQAPGDLMRELHARGRLDGFKVRR